MKRMMTEQETSMVEESKSIAKLLKWIGIIALAAVPILLIVNKLRARETDAVDDDSSNIFAEELLQ